MTLTIPIAPEVEARLRHRAAAQGEDFSEFIAKLLSHSADPPIPLEEFSGPIHERFRASGMTDDVTLQPFATIGGGSGGSLPVCR